jgi:hypothetical protein
MLCAVCYKELTVMREWYTQAVSEGSASQIESAAGSGFLSGEQRKKIEGSESCLLIPSYEFPLVVKPLQDLEVNHEYLSLY